MKGLKKSFLCILCLILAFLYLTACGGKNENETPEQTSFTVTFDLNGGKFATTGNSKTVEVEKGNTVVLPEAEKGGQLFCGWFADGEKFYETDKIYENITLKAKWIGFMGNFTVKFDKNTTPDVTDDETLGSATISRDNDAYIASGVDNVFMPERTGYRFAGWQTSPVVTEDDLFDGVSKYLWILGENLDANMAAYADPAIRTAMRIRYIDTMDDKGEATLYARWVSEKTVATEQELRDINKDLYGWYKLGCDITVSGEWTPIGDYYSNYEFFNSNWYRFAFKGKFDGNGKTVAGISVTQLSRQNHAFSLWQDGIRGNLASMFGSTVDAEITDLIIKDSVIELSGIPFSYISPAISFVMGQNGQYKNIKVIDADIKASLVNNQNNVSYASVTGFVAGHWGSNIENCSASGTMEIEFILKGNHGAEICIGGFGGEAYGLVENCSVDYDISVTVTDESTADTDDVLNIYAGGFTGANCYLRGCSFGGSVDLTVNKPNGKLNLYFGGMGGYQRYGYLEDCEAIAEISVNGNIDTTEGKIYAGGILGGFDEQFGKFNVWFGLGNKIGVYNCTIDVAFDIANTLPQNSITQGIVAGLVPPSDASFSFDAKPEDNIIM